MNKGKLIILPNKQEKKVLLYDRRGYPLIVQGNRPIGFQMKGE